MKRARDHLFRFCHPCAAIGFAALVFSPSIRAAEKLRFNRDIRPILSENCFYCHGQDGNKRKAGLRLDVRADALKPAESEEIAIVPGAPDKSALVTRIFSKDKDEQMPPPKSNRVLTAEQKEKLKRWIEEGAEYQQHWAFVAPVRAAVPEIAECGMRNGEWPDGVRAEDWSANPIDAFVLKKMVAAGLKPSPPTAPEVLIRRMTLDLIGLPPSPAEVDAFVAESLRHPPSAIRHLTDRLLASPHYGERMALPWLDAARFADSNGFQQDGDTFQWVWRDWVVRALNADMPFDQFSIEQLAGDLLPNPTSDQLIATAFNRNHLLNGEGGAIPEEQRWNNLFDRVDTTATTWMGLTMACAQCHDHKYDPITQRDYYSLLALFNNVPESGVPSGSGQYRVADPWIHAGTAEEMAKMKALENDAAAAGQNVKQLADSAETTAALAGWEKVIAGDGAADWMTLRPLSATAGDGVTLTVQDDLSIVATGPRPDKTNYTIELPGTVANLTGLRIETIPDDRLPSKGAGRSDSGNAVLTRLRASVGGKEIAFSAASADYTQQGFSPAGAIDDKPETAWAIYPDTMHPHALVVQTATLVQNAEGASDAHF